VKQETKNSEMILRTLKEMQEYYVVIEQLQI